MNVIVCIKQVPDTTNVRIDRKTNNLVREGVPSIINPDDQRALELGAQLKENFGAKVFVVTMGPPQAKEALKDAISFGLDEAFLLSDRAFAGADTLATTYTIFGGLKKLEKQIGQIDLLLFGKQAVDGDTGQVGPGIATRYGYPLGAYVVRIEKIDFENKELVVVRRLDRGYEKIKIKMPAVLTVTDELNEPRYADLPNLIRAIKYEPTTWTLKELELDPKKCGFFGSPTRVINTNIPPARKGGDIISKNEEPEKAVEKFLEVLLKKESIRLIDSLKSLLEGDN
ncbi:electron transfer flavoprotein subunit beta/FixA family protein [Thermosipho atlanticus]|uniref:Electron transfer flavoprotein beta subunit n=1 Tax=Thermosipho atlanticus DSM 15807 TaxID=1123380 RepID=A0A1M5S4U7_9BACT|nr:electron transfer flavoprotein subunit beta/FixA family protein [Thermosipho atlanticus]SHH33506.1 electron transfer flavoprotein beta subunit [Thermosipho atlanticus DSM 15807]